MAGLQVGQAFGLLLLPRLGFSSSSPQVPGHPTSKCDSGIKDIVLQGSISVTNNLCLDRTNWLNFRFNSIV